jgi:hypothetical protein
MKNSYQFLYSKKQELVLIFSEFFFFIYEVAVCLPQLIKFKFYIRYLEKKNEIIIFGNGPSLKKDLAKVKKNFQIFAVNTFLSKKFYKTYQPTFLCCIDSMFWAKYARLSKSVKQPIIDTFKELNKINYSLIIFLPSKAKKIFNKRIKNKNIRLISIPFLSYDFNSSAYINLLSLFKLPPPRVNVVITSIYISLILGIKNIKLFGVDMNSIHSYKVNQKNNLSYLEYIHFSKSKKNSVKFRDKFIDRKETSLYVKLKREASNFKWFAYVALLSKNMHVNLKNKSSESLIDSIDR